MALDSTPSTFRDYEPLVTSWWERRQCDQVPSSHAKEDLASSRPLYTVIMPPPNVTGSLHLGHALSFTYQDVLVRYHRMKGYDVWWVPGTDHAGIATQMMVEKALEAEGTSRKTLGRAEFLNRMWQWKEQHGQAIVSQMHRMGFAANWDQLHFTLDADIHHSVMTAFVRLHAKGLIYRAQRLVHWDGALQTALSDLEVVNQPAKGHLWHIRYAWTQDPSQSLVVATTRPETLFADQAVMVHPQDSRYAHWIGRTVTIPLCHRAIPVIGDESVDLDKGTGAVKVTPGHDFHDFDVGKKHGLSALSLWDEHLCYNELVPPAYRGMNRDKARTAVLEALGDDWVATESIDHHVPCSERTGTVVEPRLTWQWFMDMRSMADKARQAIENQTIRFHPQEWTNNALRWLENIQPWCLSRQLWWGHRLPVWYGPEDSVFVSMDEESAYAQARQQWGPDVVLRQDDDVLDTWFSSGLWPMATLGWPQTQGEDFLIAWQKRLPTNVLVTGFDIIFFWVARMMMLGLEMSDRPPFGDVYIHPLIRDAQGQKMSKTKNNVINPLALLEQYGTDALRFALTSATSGKQHMKFSVQNVENAKHFVTKITHLMKLARLKGVVTPTPGIDAFKEWPSWIEHPVNGWIMNKTAHMLDRWEECMKQFRFSDAALAVYQWVWREVCDGYVEWAKKELDNPLYSTEFHHTFTCVIGVALRVLHPIMPFVTEHLWHEWTGECGTLGDTVWPQGLTTHPWMEACMDDVHAMMTLLRAKRSKEAIPKTQRLVYSMRDVSPEAQRGMPYWKTTVESWIGVDFSEV